MPTTDNTLVNAMLEPGFYNHPVQHVELIETHISWVFLTGDLAYKVKKPVDFGFLDFTQLEKRKFYCEEELRLNQRLAADTYLNVIPITKANGTFQLDGDGEVVEYAVKMKQFDPHGLLKDLLDKQTINHHHIEQLADRLAQFHQHIDHADVQSSFGNSSEVIKPVQQNFILLRGIINEAQDLDKLKAIEDASLALYEELKPVFDQRKQQGFIRECHGDMHLGNIALINDQILIFDGIEFNDSFKWIDTMSELAFLIMDLQDCQQYAFANQALNRYLQNSGDFEGLKVLRFYQLHRAMVRAKVSGLQMQQQDNEELRQQQLQTLRNYLDLAISYTQDKPAFIAITYGVSGSGKSWLAERLAQHSNGIIIRSDRERKRLFSDADDLYKADITRNTYLHLISLTESIVNAGYSVFVDATFLDSHWRTEFKTLARQLDCAFHIIHCYASQQLLKQRILNRQEKNNDVSDADIAILQMQLEKNPQLLAEEAAYVIDVDTGNQPDVKAITGMLRLKVN